MTDANDLVDLPRKALVNLVLYWREVAKVRALEIERLEKLLQKPQKESTP